MSVLTEMLGEAHEFNHKGKTYKVSLITQAVKAKFEMKALARAKEVALLRRDLMDKEAYQAYLDKLDEKHFSGQFAFEGEEGQKFMKSVLGFSVLCGLLFNCDDQHEMLQLASERPDDMERLVKVVMRESFPALEDQAADGNAKN